LCSPRVRRPHAQTVPSWARDCGARRSVVVAVIYSVATTGTYAGTLLLVLRHNVLVEIGTAGGGPVRSPDGVRVGDALDSVRTTYGTRAITRTGADGLPGFVVTEGDRVLLFTGHPIRPDIGWFAAGYADHTDAAFVSGEDC
jgi:hypothetical protein